jgi:hypothetical protein
MGVWNSHGFRRYAEIFGDDGCEADDREVSTCESRRSVCTDDEREGTIQGCADDVRQQCEMCEMKDDAAAAVKAWIYGLIERGLSAITSRVLSFTR